MSVIDRLAAAQGGTYFSAAGKVAGVSEGDARAAMEKLCPAIARRLKEKAEADTESYETLLDLLEDGDGSDLDDAAAMTGADALSDGDAVLDDLYGSSEAASKALAKLAPDVPPRALSRLAALSATGVLASIAAAQAQPLAGAGVQKAAETGGGGIFGMIVGALVKGALQGAARQLAPKRRRRRRSYTSYYSKTRRKRTTRKRRTRTPSLESIFKDILLGK